MNRPTLPGPGSSLTSRWTVAVVASAAALTVVGTGTPASSVPEDQCPAAVPVADVARGQAVDGLTVSAGTRPDPFTGEVIDVLNDGILPGLDMILVKLTSPEIDRVGIWSGMSGSPVYSEDGRLIGAVSYGLSFGPSPVAGVTPAAEMQKLLSGDGDRRLSQAASDVAVPDRVARQVAATGAATEAQVADGFSQLPLPLSVSGVSSRRVAQATKKLRLGGDVRLAAAGRSRAEIDPATALVAGGNLAAALSYGDVTAAGVGTITAVCGGEVLGFGHPMMWSGPAHLSMHAADALYVQEDPTLTGFKVANLDLDPVGTITQDRMAGLLGVRGAGPVTSSVSSEVTVGDESRSGTTQIAEPDWLPDLAFFHLISNEDRVFDGIGEGTASLDWTIDGTREDGSPFSISRRDVYASKYDITFESSFGLVEALYRIQYNDLEDVTIDAVDADVDLRRPYDNYVFQKAQIKQAGRWTVLDRRTPVLLRAGTFAKIRATVESPVDGILRSVETIKVPKRTAGQRGILEVRGANNSSDGFFFRGAQSFDDVLENLESAPSNDQIVTSVSMLNRRGRITEQFERRERTGKVVDGGITVQVFVRG